MSKGKKLTLGALLAGVALTGGFLLRDDTEQKREKQYEERRSIETPVEQDEYSHQAIDYQLPTEQVESEQSVSEPVEKPSSLEALVEWVKTNKEDTDSYTLTQEQIDLFLSYDTKPETIEERLYAITTNSLYLPKEAKTLAKLLELSSEEGTRERQQYRELVKWLQGHDLEEEKGTYVDIAPPMDYNEEELKLYAQLEGLDIIRRSAQVEGKLGNRYENKLRNLVQRLNLLNTDKTNSEDMLPLVRRLLVENEGAFTFDAGYALGIYAKVALDKYVQRANRLIEEQQVLAPISHVRSGLETYIDLADRNIAIDESKRQLAKETLERFNDVYNP